MILVDQADPDCEAACTPSGDSCISDNQCCSGKCRGGRNRTCKGDVACTPTQNPEASCGDGLDNDCDGLTDGADPDCGCTVTENPEVSCSDGQDNDCDGGVDGSDSDCQVGCSPKGAQCSADGDCCSNKCRGPSGGRSCK